MKARVRHDVSHSYDEWPHQLGIVMDTAAGLHRPSWVPTNRHHLWKSSCCQVNLNANSLSVVSENSWRTSSMLSVLQSLKSQLKGNATHKMQSVYSCKLLCRQDSPIYMTIPFMDVIFMGSLRYVALTIAVWLYGMQGKLQCYNLKLCSGSICMRFLC